MREATMLFWLIVILAGACGIGWLALRLIRKYKTGENWALGALILTALGFLIYVLMAGMGVEKLLLWTIPPSAFVFGSAVILLSRQHWSNVPRTNKDVDTNKYTKQIWLKCSKFAAPPGTRAASPPRPKAVRWLGYNWARLLRWASEHPIIALAPPVVLVTSCGAN